MATGMEAFGPAGAFSVADLERMPDDELRYELLDGTCQKRHEMSLKAPRR